MGGVTRQHRAAARLRNVAHQNARPDPRRRRLAREAFEEGDGLGMPPEPIARQPHHPPRLAIDGQRPGSGEAAMRIEADRAGLRLRRRHRPPEDLTGGIIGIAGVGERGKRLALERALVLRAPGIGDARKSDGDGRT